MAEPRAEAISVSQAAGSPSWTVPRLFEPLLYNTLFASESKPYSLLAHFAYEVVVIVDLCRAAM